MKKSMSRLFLLLCSVTILMSSNVFSAPSVKQNKKKDELLRTVNNVFDLQQNTVSNIQFYTTNYGIFGLNVTHNNGGGHWPRGSLNQYIYGGGIWFACKKRDNNGDIRKLCEVTYNPKYANSWMVPGRIDNNVQLVDPNDKDSYKTYFSTDFNLNGTPRGKDVTETDPNWPIWDSSSDPEDVLKENRYFGYYILDKSKRNINTYGKGPAFISGEDIFSTYKDTDLNYFDGGRAKMAQQGYPMKVQFEQMIYSWGYGDYKDFIFIKFDIISFSADTLYQCWMAPIMDVDLAREPNTSHGAGNDRVRFYDKDKTLNMAVQWSNPDRGEANRGFGYLGFDFLESPSIVPLDTKDINGKIVDSAGFIRRDRRWYENKDQLGLMSFNNWNVDADKEGSVEMYDFLASLAHDGDNGAGDKRYMMATGPFNMRPYDTARVVVGIIIANSADGKNATGTDSDMKLLVKKDKFAQTVYDNNFQAPAPPDPATFTVAKGLNNGAMIKWDSSSELSSDKSEAGLSFMGYRLYRARRTDLDTFSVDTRVPDSKYSKGRGPMAWREVGHWNIQSPFVKSSYKPINLDADKEYGFIDSMHVLGSALSTITPIPGKTDPMNIKVMRICKGCIVSQLDSLEFENNFSNANHPGKPFYKLPSGGDSSQFKLDLVPEILAVDTSKNSAPWGLFFNKLASQSALNDKKVAYTYNYSDLVTKDTKAKEIFESVLVGTVVLNPAILEYNPLYFFKESESAIPSNIIKYKKDSIVYERVKAKTDSILWKGDIAIDTVQVDTVVNGDVLKIYYPHSVTSKIVDGNLKYSIDVRSPKSIDTVMKHKDHIDWVLKEVYRYIAIGAAHVEFPKFTTRKDVRENIIVPYMTEKTNNRTFVDIADNLRDGYFDTNKDPKLTEKMINNVDYFYKLLSYDEGDYNQKTSMKTNAAQEASPNFIKVIPKAAGPSERLTFNVQLDSTRAGSLTNFNMFAYDEQKALQLFSGHTFELSIEPYWSLRKYKFFGKTEEEKFGLYHRIVTLRDTTTDEILYEMITQLEPDDCVFGVTKQFTENSKSFVMADSLIYDSVNVRYYRGLDTFNTMGQSTSIEVEDRFGTFTTGKYAKQGYCRAIGTNYDNRSYKAWNQKAYGTLGFSFDYFLRQFGGKYRPYKAEVIKGPKSLPLGFDLASTLSTTLSADSLVQIYPVNIPTTAKIVSNDPNSYHIYDKTSVFKSVRAMYTSCNNGPGEYLLEFSAGRDTIMDLIYLPRGGVPEARKFKVKYLNVKVKNVYELKEGNRKVTYPNYLQVTKFDTCSSRLKLKAEHNPNDPNSGSIIYDGTGYPHIRNEIIKGNNTDKFINKFSISAIGWIGNRNKSNSISLRYSIAIARDPKITYTKSNFTTQPMQYTGFQGDKYYLSATALDGKGEVVDFTHLVQINGVDFAIDFANKGSYKQTADRWPTVDNFDYKEDLKAGDQIKFSTFGGAFGFPEPGSKITINVGKASEKMTDPIMDQIKIVPNPYYIAHQGQKSPYDAKIYFTRLPKECTIDIYTITGDLVKSINHNAIESGSEDKVGLDIWDLLSDNKQRVASQALIAVITDKDGSQTVKNFSVVIGGFRVLTGD